MVSMFEHNINIGFTSLSPAQATLRIIHIDLCKRYKQTESSIRTARAHGESCVHISKLQATLEDLSKRIERTYQASCAADKDAIQASIDSATWLRGAK